MIGKYRLLEKIGQGGMGSVWKAERSDLGNFVAIKLLPKQVVGNPSLVARFQREAHLMATLNHTNIVQAFDTGEADGQPYYVMPFLEGASVGEIMRQCGRMGVRTALSIALQVVRGLQYAHERGMVHRDLKPDNLFILHDGTVKILDLGLTKLVAPSDAHAQKERTTLKGLIVGTPHYMSPEQILGDENIDGRSDIYSLGCTLFQMLGGDVPFPSNQVGKVLRAKLDGPTPDLRDRRDDLPEGVRKLILAMMARRAADRPGDGATLEAELEALLDGKPVSGSALAPGNIVLGVSERQSRTYKIGSSAENEDAKALELARSKRSTLVRTTDPSTTSIVPRMVGIPDGDSKRDEAPPAAAAPAKPDPAPDQAAAAPEAPPPVSVKSPPAAPARTEPPGPPRVQVGLAGQIVAAVVLVILTVLITLAVVRMQSESRRPPAPPHGAP
ncbi:MAG: serine/threonine protein kinase [Planctomycetota bacterium]|nr:serine/threonine protein kinase [Planctomycetota bacterium]